MFELADEATPVDFKIASVDQKACDAEGKYKQTFETDENGEDLLVTIDDDDEFNRIADTFEDLLCIERFFRYS